MREKYLKLTNKALVILALLFLWSSPLFAQDMAIEYMCELGKASFVQGKFDDALAEFNKVLVVDPDNKIAKEYVGLIFSSSGRLAPEVKSYAQAKEEDIALSKNDAMSLAITELEAKTQVKRVDGFVEGSKKDPLDEEKKRGFLIGGVRVTGEALLSFGVTPNDFIWKQANYDLNERNWRVLSDAAYNNRFNTFDARVYDSLSVNLDTENASGFNLHTNVTVDPWSFTGKSSKFTVIGAGGDAADRKSVV